MPPIAAEYEPPTLPSNCPNAPPSPFLNTGEAAAYIRTAEPTMRYWRMIGKGPKWAKPGKCVIYRIADLDAYIESVTVDPNMLESA